MSEPQVSAAELRALLDKQAITEVLQPRRRPG
jgi:hypothetical protein